MPKSDYDRGYEDGYQAARAEFDGYDDTDESDPFDDEDYEPDFYADTFAEDDDDDLPE